MSRSFCVSLFLQALQVTCLPSRSPALSAHLIRRELRRDVHASRRSYLGRRLGPGRRPYVQVLLSTSSAPSLEVLEENKIGQRFALACRHTYTVRALLPNTR
ncbi:hypothetical protein B0H63DRAFT_258171 [Podospora didyma]|uniref:Secreted protein n=1 Tax=Podospora didyma TaxID=330526 RepID=A0AAE0KF62_9PEZI|nr:hypothetical protein B0H63DRAFT_258171 [Podospora didyma]